MKLDFNDKTTWIPHKEALSEFAPLSDLERYVQSKIMMAVYAVITSLKDPQISVLEEATARLERVLRRVCVYKNLDFDDFTQASLLLSHSDWANDVDFSFVQNFVLNFYDSAARQDLRVFIHQTELLLETVKEIIAMKNCQQMTERMLLIRLNAKRINQG